MATDKPFPMKLDVRGELDTSMPIGDRPPGTLIAATDLESKAWSPRRGSQAFTQAMEGPGTASLYDGIAFTTGASTFGLGISFEEQFRDLGTKFTLDLWFRLSDLSFAAGKDEIGLYKFVVNALGAIDVSILGPNVADHEKVRVEITTTPTTTSADALVGITGTSRITVGSTQAVKQHVRVVRDGANLYLYVNGALETSSAALVATSGIIGPVGTAAVVGLGTSYATPDPTVTLKGTFYGAVLRDGAFNSQPIEARFPCAPHARNVHHFYLGRNLALGGNDHVFDAGRFGAHARVNGAGYSVTSANDNAAPAPCSVQGIRSWTTRTNRTATSVMVGGQLCTKGIS